MRKTLMLGVFLTLTFLASQVLADAGGEPSMKMLMDEIQALKGRVNDLEMRLTEQEKKYAQDVGAAQYAPSVDQHEDHVFHSKGVKEMFEYGGFRIGAGGTFVVQGTPNANNAGEKEDSRVDAEYTLEIELEKQFADWGLAYILMEPGQGQGLDEDLSLFSIVNFDTYDTGSLPEVTEAWYEHYFFDGQLTVTGGKLYAPNYVDTNEYANDETSQFLSRMFRTADTINYPDRDWVIGLRSKIAPTALDFMEFEGMWVEADGDWENIFDHTFATAQVNLKPEKIFGYDEEMWAGNYRMYFFYNGTDHTKWKDPEANKEANFGMGLSCDQKLGDVFGWFGRLGWADPKVSVLEYNWSTGLQMTGKYWNREEDVLAFGVGQAIPGKQYGDADHPDSPETHIETYYAIKLNECLTISPDLQFIWHPDGVSKKDDGDKDSVFVYGVRGQVGF